MQYSKSSCESSSSSLDSPRLAFGSPTQPFPDFVAYISLASGCTCTTRFIRNMTAPPSSRFSRCGTGVGIHVHRYSELTPNRRVNLTGCARSLLGGRQSSSDLALSLHRLKIWYVASII